MKAERQRQILDLLRDKLPEHRFVGVNSVIRHSQVEFVHNIIASSAIAEQVDLWWAEDRQKTTAPGGRPRLVSTQTILTLLLLLGTEHNSLLFDEMAYLVAHRLTKPSLRLLGLYGKRDKDGNLRDSGAWYFPLRNALIDHVLDPIDPKPGRRNKFQTLTEIEANVRKREADGAATKQARIDWVCNQLLEATIKVLPEDVYAGWNGDFAVDATVVPAYGKRGAPFSKTDDPDKKYGAVEPDAGWYMRDHKHNVVGEKRKARKAIFGWDLTLVAQVASDPTAVASHPLLVAGIAMNVPSTGLIPAARGIMESIVERGYKTGRLTGDRGYAAGADPKDYQIPVRQMGFDIVTDYKSDQLGQQDGWGGAIMVEGAFYCPTMPERLRNSTIRYQAKEITWEQWQSQLVERRRFRLRPKETTPDSKGSVPMMCPARGPGATATCPLVAACNSAKDYDGRRPITNPPKEKDRDVICTNKSSVTFSIERGAKFYQPLQFGSPEWISTYATDRSTIEGINGYLKNGGRVNIDDATQRKLRGYSAQYLLITVLVAVANLKKIQAFRDELDKLKTDVERELHFERKQQAKDTRKARDRFRIGRWDSFTEKTDDQKQDDPPEGR